MKVNEGQGPKMESIGRVKVKNGSNGDDFKKIMDQVTSGQEVKQSTSQSFNAVTNIDSIIGVNRITPVDVVPVSHDKRMLMDSLRDTLNLIDFYAGKLGDGSVPAEDLTPLIEQLDNRLESLKIISEGDNVPDELKPVISEMTVTIGTEIQRFKRGDYI
jgi:hypothetical protein